MAAAQLAPYAIGAAETVGEGAVGLASGVGSASHAAIYRSKKEEDARQSAMNSGDSCDQLEVEVPGVIELRRSADWCAGVSRAADSRLDRPAAMGAGQGQ